MAPTIPASVPAGSFRRGKSTRAGVLALIAVAAVVVGAEPEIAPGDLPRFPPLDPAQALEAFDIRPGFRIELAACEPELVDPVAIAFDETGALFVVEMRDYSERRAEKLSRVRRLVDRDGDGRFESATTFFDGLAWATGVACWDGGVFVIASPDVWFARDVDNDGVADEKRVVLTGFGSERGKLNVQALPNSLTWGPDARLYGATAANGGRVRAFSGDPPAGEPADLNGSDFSVDPRTLEFRAESGTAQFGLTFDALGRRYVCSNSRHIQWVSHERREALGAVRHPLPPPLVDIPVDGAAAEVFRISPEEPWRVVRTRWRVGGLVTGPIEGGGRASGYFTSACGIHCARGTVCTGDFFIGDVGSNLVHRKTLRETDDGPVAERPRDESRREFLASRDTWFRPVAFADGPDGALYVADMYREFIEHPDSLPPALKQHLDLNSGNDRGRIWRIVADGSGTASRTIPHPPATSELVRWLKHDNGWHRQTAMRLLLARGDPAVAGDLRASRTPETIGLLRALGWIKPADIREALLDPTPPMRVAGLRLIADFPSALDTNLPTLAKDPEPVVRQRLALALQSPGVSDRIAILSELISNLPASSRLVQFALSAVRTDAEAAEIFALCRPADESAAMDFAVILRLEPSHPAIAEMNATARGWLGSDRAGEDKQLAAVRFLSRVGRDSRSEQDADLLRTVALNSRRPPTVRMAALGQSSGAAEALLDEWTRLPASLRDHALEKLLATSAGAGRLLDAVADGRVAPLELPASHASRLRAHSDARVRGRARNLLGEPLADRRALVESSFPVLKLAGDAVRGRDVFRQRCLTCHRDGSDGADVGPDRASFRNLGVATLLVAILDPNREVAPQFFTAMARTRAGETHAGLIIHEDPLSVTIRHVGGHQLNLPRAEIERLDRQSRSLMPEGLEAGLDHQALADLLAFLVQ